MQVYSIPEQPNTFVYQYKHYLTTYGHKATIEALLEKLSSEMDPATRYEITFQNHHLASIKRYFSDFDFIDESGTDAEGINNLQAMSLEKSNFTPKRVLKTGKRIRPDLLEAFDPELKEYAESGIVYGILENMELKSVCPVPFIVKNIDYSFAIIHQVYTDERYRRKGYATGSVRAALNFLFTRKAIKSVYLWVDEDNPAVTLFQRIGFDVTEKGGFWRGTRCFLA